MKKLVVITISLMVTILVISCGGDSSKSNTKSQPNSEKSKAILESKTITKSENQIVELTPQQKLGKRLFIMCEACHNVNEGEPHKVGPNLHGVFGRKAGSVTDFKYSEAVINSDIVWSDETIREWLINPNDYIKGTNMVFVGLPKKRQQDALLSYLHHVAE